MSEIKHFKVLLLCEMIWQMMLDRYWHDMTWLDTDIDTFHVKKIELNNL
jgi:hypothetical protein